MRHEQGTWNVEELEFPGVENRERFVEFALNLRTQVIGDPDAFENATMPRFLEALAAFVENRRSIPVGIDWNFLALLLYAGLNYE